jgi:hypothetical protein
MHGTYNVHSSPQSQYNEIMMLKVGSFNILADGLSLNEFLCEGSDIESAAWSSRASKVVGIIANMLLTCDVVVTQENDHFVYILDCLISSYHLNVGGVFGCDVSRLSVSRSLSIHQLFLACCSNDLMQSSTTVASSKDKQHEQHYAYCNSLFKSNQLTTALASNNNNNRAAVASSRVWRSFDQESPLYGEVLASLYGCSKHDLYRSDDGIGIYYRRDKLILKEVDVPRKANNDDDDDDDLAPSTDDTHVGLLPIHGVIHVKDQLYIHSEMERGSGFLRCTFQMFGAADGSGDDDDNDRAVSTGEACTRTVITLYGGHLKSGEQLESEITRCQQLRMALEDAKGRPNPVLAMDSNNSVLYEQAYAYSCESPTASSQQQQQRSSSIENELSEHVHRLSALIAAYHYTDAVSLQRGTECFKMRHGQGGQSEKSFKLMFDTIDKILVPITGALSILPHVFDRDEYGFRRYDPRNRDFILGIRSSETKRVQLEEHCRATIHTTCSVEAFGATHPFAELYPNIKAPSDHPPVSCMIELLSLS